MPEHTHTSDNAHEICTLCGHAQSTFLDRDKQRAYYQCANCQLVLVPSRFHLSPEEEKAIYDYHENDPEDQGYRQFLQRLATPLMAKLPEGAQGIDVGCGPGPTLSRLLQEAGFRCTLYDPFYYPDKTVLSTRYDFVCATEVVEHFCQPKAGFDQLFSLLKPGGVLGIMTKTIPEFKRFSQWHYTRDLTHVSFYAKQTLAWIADHYGCTLSILRSDTAIFERQ
ncbi:MAG: class I SAM-dependent methyltransferase [Oleiphilaceae bacterium]|nr:class I SAM-dependent methyltransferase [Oleiphilaceae bacterium]